MQIFHMPTCLSQPQICLCACVCVSVCKCVWACLAYRQIGCLSDCLLLPCVAFSCSRKGKCFADNLNYARKMQMRFPRPCPPSFAMILPLFPTAFPLFFLCFPLFCSQQNNMHY